MDVVTEASPRQCANPDCQVATDGRCVEGVSDLKVCPHYGRAVLIIEDTRPEGPAAVGRGLRLPDAEALSVTGAQAVLRNQACSVIAIIGPHDSGKTSLIGSIYDLLQHGPVGGYAFAGSTTLHSFERACHDCRTASNREEPHMERTATGDATYFHRKRGAKAVLKSISFPIRSKPSVTKPRSPHACQTRWHRTHRQPSQAFHAPPGCGACAR